MLCHQRVLPEYVSRSEQVAQRIPPLVGERDPHAESTIGFESHAPYRCPRPTVSHQGRAMGLESLYNHGPNRLKRLTCLLTAELTETV